MFYAVTGTVIINLSKTHQIIDLKLMNLTAYKLYSMKGLNFYLHILEFTKIS